MVTFLSQFDIILVGILASVATGLATGVGGTLIFFIKGLPKKMLDASLGVAAGVMLAATSFSLIIPAIEKAGGGLFGALTALVGILLGGVFLDGIDRRFPDSNLMLNSTVIDESIAIKARLRKVWLFIIAITLHNFPEGLAVGVGFGDGDIKNGLSIAIGIGLQNLPEGFAVALPLIREKFPKWKAFLIALATGLVEPVGGLLGIGIGQIASQMLPLMLAFAAGTMLFVISHEIIPESQNDHRYSRIATHALLVGFVVMMFLDNTLG